MTVVKTFIPHDGSPSRTFECLLTDVFGDYSTINVSVYEVRPNRKWWQSRTTYCGEDWFFTDDFPTVSEGIESILHTLLGREDSFYKRKKKFENL